MIVIEAAKVLKEYCHARGNCKGCPFDYPSCCGINAIPEEWDLEKVNYEPISEDIQHVGYTPEACGYEK